MIKRAVLLAVCFAILAVPIAAGQQQPPPPPPPAANQEKPTPPPAPPTPPAPSIRPTFQPVTVRIDLTISDQVGTAPVVKKTMTLLAADGERASVRSVNRTADQRDAVFNVDARPVLTQDKIRLDLGVVYDPPEIPRTDPLGTDKKFGWTTSLQQSMGILLENGKPLVVSQSADPRTDRKVTVEVKATILK
jgi:hypothetical protein